MSIQGFIFSMFWCSSEPCAVSSEGVLFEKLLQHHAQVPKDSRERTTITTSIFFRSTEQFKNKQENPQQKRQLQFSLEHPPVMDYSHHSPFLSAKMVESDSEVAGKAEMIAGFH